MSLLLFTAATASLIGGGLRAAASAREKQAAYDAKLRELERQREALDESYNQAIESRALSHTHQEAIKKERGDEIDYLSGIAEENFERTHGQLQRQARDQSLLSAMHISTLAVEAGMAESEATQAVAASGFRGTGTAFSRAENVSEASAFAMSKASMQVRASNAQAFASAKNNYVNHEQQQAAYDRELDKLDDAWGRYMEQKEMEDRHLEDTYARKGGFIGSEIDYMEGEGWDNLQTSMGLDAFGHIFSGFSSGISMAM